MADAHRGGIDRLGEGNPEGQVAVCAGTRRVIDRAQWWIDGIDHVVCRGDSCALVLPATSIASPASNVMTFVGSSTSASAVYVLVQTVPSALPN